MSEHHTGHVLGSEDEPAPGPSRPAQSDLQRALDATFGSIPDLKVPSRDEWDGAGHRGAAGDERPSGTSSKT